MIPKKRKRAKIEFWNPKVQERLQNAGRGKGILHSYKPWIEVQDFSSDGICSRVRGWRTGRRDIHLFSNFELYHFYTLEWDDSVWDYREQFPLDLAVTRSICDRRGVKHPCDGPDDDPIVMTTDVRITHKDVDGNKSDVCRSIKPAGFFRLQFSDIVDFSSFIAQLKEGNNPHRFSAWLFDSFTSSTRQRVRAHKGQDDPSLLQVVIRELNSLLSREVVYSDERFKGIYLNEGLYQEVLANPTGDAILRVNRLLLKAAFPFDFSDRPPIEELTDQAKAKIQVEKEYWSVAEGNCIRFETITGSEIDWVLARNVEEIHQYRTLTLYGISDGDAKTVGEFMWKEISKANRPLIEIAELTDSERNLSTGTALSIAKNRIAAKSWPIDLSQPLTTYRPLSLLA